MWSALRMHRINNARFRRQQQIGPYIVDFFCPEAKLIIEVDGSQHAEEAEAWYDKRRTEWLQAAGYRVIRFWNGEILRQPYQCIEAISQVLTEQGVPPSAPSGDLPPQGGKGNGDAP